MGRVRLKLLQLLFRSRLYDKLPAKWKKRIRKEYFGSWVRIINRNKIS